MRALLIGLLANYAVLAAQSGTASIPLFFIENRGQAPADVRFMVKGSGIAAYFSASEVLYRAGGKSVRIEFPGANYSIPEGSGEMPGRANFIGGRLEEWVTGVSLFRGVVYRDLYPGIDLRYGADGRNLKSQFEVAPGADASAILMRYGNAPNLRIGSKGELLIPLNGRELREEVPEVYQEDAVGRVTVEGHFVLAGAGAVRLEVGEYNRSLPLIVDPTLSYSTLLGGSSASAGTAMAVDANGFAYITGYTSSYNFPTVGPEQNVNAGGNEVFVTKMDIAGNGLVYSTYIGGSADDRGYGIAVDTTGAAYVTGSTTSWNFPTRYPIQPALLGGKNAFVLKLSPAGNALVFSTYLGGSGSDAGNGIALDLSANVYVVGDTTSLNFPATGLQKGNKGGQDAFVACIKSNGSSLLYSTYLGGSGTDHGAAIAVDSSGGAYVTGSTFSVDFPVSGAFQPAIGGGQDAFVARVAPGGSALTFSTYLGGSGGTVGSPEAGQGIALDSQANVYVAGVTPSTNFPVLNALQPSLDAGLDAFVAKLSSTGTLLYSTYLGGSGIDVGNAIAVNSSGNAFVVGYTASSDFPIQGGLQSANAGGYDAFLAELSSTGTALLWSSYLGGSSSDTATAVALDPEANLYVAGWTLSTNFPLANPYQSVNTDNYDAFVTKIVFPTAVPAVLGVTPGSGSGSTQTFTLQFSDSSGAADIASVAVLFNTSTGLSSACSVTYVSSQNALTLLTDVGAAPATTLTPGSGTAQNSQCILNGAGSSVTLSGNTLTLNLALTFQSAFAGNKSVYLEAANPAGSTGWLSKGSWTVQVSTMAAVSVSPSSGSGWSQTFAFQFSDTSGTADLTSLSISIDTSASTVSACSVSYVRAQNTLALLTDAGAAPATTLTPGSGTAQNSQCILNGAGSSVSASGNVLTLNLALTFEGAFAGAKTVYMQAANASGSTGWQSKGAWTVQFGAIAAVSVSPASGSGSVQTFAFQFSDTAGATDLTSVSILIDTSASTVSACSVTYVRAQNTLALLTDAGAAPATTLTPGSGSQQNSQCVLNGASSSVSTSGNVLNLTLALTFQTAFQGAKIVYMQAANAGGSTGWQSEGAWTVQFAVASVVSVSPSSGSGSSQAFTFQFSDTAGATDLTSVSILINSSASTVSACSVTYVRAQNTLGLLTDAGAAPATILTPGSGSQQNSQCSLNGASSSVSAAGNVLTLTLALTFQSVFSGAKSIFMQASDPYGTSSWQAEGTWTVVVSTTLGVSVSPSSGSGSAQTFALQFSDGAGAADLISVSVLFNSSASTTAACAATYNPALNTLMLLTDAGASPGATLTLGTGSQQNSQCTVYASGSSVSTSGNVLTLNLAITFQSAFQGAKNIYMQATNPSGSIAWQSEGTWTVQASVELLSGIVSYWSANGTAIDSVSAYNGTLENGATYAAGRVGQAFNLSGSGAYVQVNGTGTIGGPRTYCAWVYPQSGTTGLPVLAAGAVNAADFLTIHGSTLLVDHWGFPQYTSSLTVTAGSWNHIAVTYDGSTVQFYVNGVAANPISGSLYNYGVNTLEIGGNTIGGSTTGASFDGMIEEVQWYSRALAASEVKSIFGGGSAGTGVPTAVSVTPASGSGASQTFAFQFFDPAGATDLTSVSVLINSSASTASACLVTYLQAQNSLALTTDAGASPGTTISPGSGTQQNSQCILNGAASGVSVSGNVLILNLALAFQAGLSGSKTVYMEAVNPSGSTGWQSKGVWTVQFTAGVVSVSPASGSGASQTFVFQFSDNGGAADLATVSTLFNASASTASACSVTYARAQNTLALLTDAGASPGSTIAPGSGSQQNSQCVLNGAGSSVSMSGNVLTLSLALTFQTSAAGSKTVYLSAANGTGSTGWQAKGTWTVQFGASLVSVTPASGGGLSQVFQFQFSDTGGAANLTSVSALFNASASTTAACSVTYIRAQNSLELLTDTGAIPGATISPGSGTEQNSQCTLNGASSSVATAGNVLTLNLSLTFQSAFNGAKIIYMDAADPSGTTGWQAAGSWSVQASVVLLSGLISYWSGNGTANDSVSGNNGILENGATYASGYTGQAFSLNGAGAYVQVSGTGAVTGPRSYCAWVYPQTGTTGLPVLAGGAVGAADFLSIHGSTLFVDHWGYPQYTSSLAVTPGSWNHVAVTYDGSTVQFYVNGVAASPITGSLYNYNVSTLEIGGNTVGGSTTGPSFNGMIEEVQWYSRALVASEVKSIYSGSGGGTGAPSVLSVSPASGSGASQTFAFQFSDTAGAGELTSVSVLINSTTSASSACSVTYVQAQNTLALATDAGASPGATIAPGSGTQQNSQCTLSGTGSSVSTSGNTLTLSLALTFQSGLNGAKNIYMQATDPYATTGWQAKGAWTVSVVVYPANLMSYWSGNDTAIDSVSGNNGTLENGATYGSGHIGQAFSLNGSGAYVQVSGTAAISGARSYCAWVYPQAGTTGMPVLAAGAVGAADFLSVHGSTLFVDHWGFPQYTSSLAVTPGTWNHVAVTYNGSTVQFYVNGVAASPITGSFYNYSVSTLEIGGNTIGGSTTGASFNGMIEEVEWYSRALSASEVLSLASQ